MKKLLLSTILLFLVIAVQAQWVAIPQSFATYIQTYVDSAAVNGSQLDTTNSAIIALQDLTICDGSVTDITGIQYFKGLQYLSVGLWGTCWSNVTTLPVLPSGLIYLETACYNLTTIPYGLPDSLNTLKLYSSCLSPFPVLPSTLKMLVLDKSCYTSLPVLPNGLDTLIADTCTNLTSLPSPLPDSLVYLSAYNTNLTGTLALIPPKVNYMNLGYDSNLTSITNLPDSLIYLEATSCNLTGTLPAVPSKVNYIDVSYNHNITAIPNLSAALVTFNSSYSSLTTLPAPIPSSIRYLYMQYSLVATLPQVPDTFIVFDIDHTPISSLVNIPNVAVNLYMDSLYNLAGLPNYPTSICNLSSSYDPQLDIKGLLNNITQYCPFDRQNTSYAPTIVVSHDGLDSFPINSAQAVYNASFDAWYLPYFDISLDASYNNITYINAAAFYTSLVNIDLSHNQITGYDLPATNNIPPIWVGLGWYFDCNSQYGLNLSYNKLDSITGGSLPPYANLNLQNNNISKISSLLDYDYLYGGGGPAYSSAGSLTISLDSNQITCLPFVPDYICSISLTGNPITCAPNNNNGYSGVYTLDGYSTNYLPVCGQGNPNNCFPTGTITGTVFNDLNHNGVWDPGEPGVPNWPVNITVNGIPMKYNTDYNGNYSLNTTLSQNSTVSDFVTTSTIYTTPTSVSLDLTNNWQVDSLVNFGIIYNPPQPIPPDTNLLFCFTATTQARPGFNQSYYVNLYNRGTVPLSGRVVMYFDSALYYQNTSPSGTVAGDSITWSFNNIAPYTGAKFYADFIIPAIVPLGSLINAGAHVYFPSYPELNQFDTISQIAIGSYDPNEKEVSPTALSQEDIDTLATLTYTVRFQNTGTASAINVYVKDTLNHYLDLRTFHFLASSAVAYWGIENGVLTVNFYNISLPDSGTSQANSCAFFKYSIQPNNTFNSSDIITNTAYITFDQNEPVATNTSESAVAVPQPVITSAQGFTICPGKVLVLRSDTTISYLAYQWFKNGTLIPNARGSDYVVTDSGFYSVQASFAGDTEISGPILITILPPIFDTISQTICKGQAVNGHDATGTYVDTLIAADACDSIVTLILTVLPSKRDTFALSICAGQTYDGYSTPGSYLTVFTGSNGCDSFTNLILTVLPVYRDTVNQSICQGDTFKSHTLTGFYSDTFTSLNGCDSIRTLNLTVSPTNDTISQTICLGDTFQGHNISGYYTDSLKTINGCDSIVTLHLSILPAYNYLTYQVICQGDSFEGYTTSGFYSDSLKTINGCDSIVTLELVVMSVDKDTINRSICLGDTFAGHTTPGSYTDTLNSVHGCDSIVTLNLTVQPFAHFSITQQICQGDSFLHHTSTGTYIDTIPNAVGCDSIRTLHLTVNESVYDTLYDTTLTKSHDTSFVHIDTLIAANGCDSIVTLFITVKDTATGIATVNDVEPQLTLFPNPASTGINLSATFEMDGYVVYNPEGQEITRRDNIKTKQATIDLQGWAKGVYFLEATVGQQKIVRRFAVL